MCGPFLTLACGDQSLALDPALGTLRDLRLVHGGRPIAPLHRAPWLDDPQVRDDPRLLPVERALSGDFFCAPFGAHGLAGIPTHGWTANSAWEPLPDAGGLTLRLGRDVMGATVTKRLRLAPDAPILYQTHRIEGGQGALTVAHHPMVRLAGAGRLSLSPKRRALTPEAPLEPGRHRLRYPAEGSDLAAFPGVDGPADLTRLPLGDGHEDFAVLVEAAGSPLGWSAVLRAAENDVVFVLKDPAVLPVTMLWWSNGGRDHAPWSGRHLGVIGIEDACAAGAGGLALASGPNPVAATGVPTTLALGGVHRIAHAIGAIARPPGWTRVADIALRGGTLTLSGDDGTRVDLPFDPAHFA